MKETNGMCTGCSRKNCTKFKHHNFATTHHRVMQFSAKWSEENVYTLKASVSIRQLNILCYAADRWSIWKQSSRLGDTFTFCFHIGVYTIVLGVRRHLHSKNLITREPSTTYLAPTHTFFKCLHHSIISVWLLLSRTELHSVKATNHSWQFSQLKNVKFQFLSWSAMDSYLSIVVLLGCKLSH